MPCPPRYVTLIDGAFALAKLSTHLRRFPSVADIRAVADTIAGHEHVSGLTCFRTYFYHASPSTEDVTNPLSKQRIALAETPIHTMHSRLLWDLETAPDFALRLGKTYVSGWKVGDAAVRDLIRKPRALQANDLVPVIEQKGVDLRIGLDIARLSLRHAVQAIVVVTGDSDLAPAFSFARREAIRVILCRLGHGVRRELAVHADRDMEIVMPMTARSASFEAEAA